MFCPVCGTAIQMVPDYDLSVEESIAVSQDVISDSISEITPDGRRRVDQNTVELPAANEAANIIDKTRLVVSIIAVVLVAAIIGTIVFYNRMRVGASPEELLAAADEAFEGGEYDEAVVKYGEILDSEAETEEEIVRAATVRYAISLYRSGDTDKALVVLSTRLSQAPEDEAALTALMDIYAEESEVAKINETVSSISNEELREKFSGYMSLPPEFSVKPGEYGEEFKLAITSQQLGNIYYTTDGSEPTVNSEAYSGELDISEGDTVVKAIFVNTHDLVSETAVAEYKVQFEAPEKPVVLPESGSFSQPEYITLIVPEGVSAYYTTDGSDPDENSTPYEKQLTMPLGKSTYKFAFLSDKGVWSEITEVSYELQVNGLYSPADAINYTTASLAASGHIADIFGTPSPTSAVIGRYVYKCDYAAREGNRTYYLIDEYIDNGSGKQKATGEVYAVDSAGGMLYRAKEDDEGKWSFTLYY